MAQKQCNTNRLWPISATVDSTGGEREAMTHHPPEDPQQKLLVLRVLLGHQEIGKGLQVFWGQAVGVLSSIQLHEDGQALG